MSGRIAEIILAGKSEQSVRNGLGVIMPGLEKEDEAVRTFVWWLFDELHAMKVEAETVGVAECAKQRVRNLEELPALRLHIVGRGKVGKNYSAGTARDIAHARARPEKLAKALVHGSRTNSIRDIPAFIARVANGDRRRRDYGTVHDPPGAARRTLPLDPMRPQEADQPRICHFPRLPAELRNAIYEYSFSHHVDSDGEVNLLTESPPQPALTQTCKQIHGETNSMCQHKKQQFWRTSNFFLDSSIFPTGFHVRPQLVRCQAPEWKDITNLRITLDAEVGVFDAFMEKDYWLTQQGGGPGPLGLGIGGAYYGGVVTTAGEDIVFWQIRDDQRLQTRYNSRRDKEYDFGLDNHGTPSTLQYLIDELADGKKERIPLAGQICAILEEFGVWR